MHTLIITWDKLGKYGAEWVEHLKIRKKNFVDQCDWKVPHNDLIEWDQYDNGLAHYVLTIMNGKVAAASRLLPCNKEHCEISYMLRDACLGRLDGMPTNLLKEPPTDDKTWEATRFAVNIDLAPKEREAALKHNALELAQYAHSLGAEKVLLLMQPAFIRWLGNIGLTLKKAGPTMKDTEGKNMCAIEVSITPSNEQIAA
jgi:N-acyl-L-homoserine lactone synthetase